MTLNVRELVQLIIIMRINSKPHQPKDNLQRGVTPSLATVDGRRRASQENWPTAPPRFVSASRKMFTRAPLENKNMVKGRTRRDGRSWNAV